MGELHSIVSPEAKVMEAHHAIEPLYPLAVAVEMIPMRTMNALYLFLDRNKKLFPARYMKTRINHMTVEVRMLYLSEIKRIRQMLLIVDGNDKYHSIKFQEARQLQRKVRSLSPIDAIMQRAMNHV